jgi:fatty-acid desaturase
MNNDGTEPFTARGRPPVTFQGQVRVGVTTAFVVVPFAGLAAAVWLAWGHGLGTADILLAVALYVITGLGVTVGFHRLLTHRSFTATALGALLWAGLVRIAALQHVTWSVNSLCHVFGARPFATRRHDRPTNLWPLALVSFGESWHNMHHSDPACARHGADRGQVDISAAVIRIFERLGWATNVRWPTPARLDSRRTDRT